jgi:hypothetical protein
LIWFLLKRSERKYIHVGNLNKPQGIIGFKSAAIGTPVFDSGDRYTIILETIDGTKNLELTYYKNNLAPAIDFFPEFEKEKI